MAKSADPKAAPAKTAAQTQDDILFEEKKKSRKRRRQERNHLPDAGELNITAMMDMLTIILVFLLKSYNTDPAANMSADLQPPVSNSSTPMKEAITVTISRNDITVDDNPVVRLQSGVVPPSEFSVADQPLLIGALRDALLARVEYHRKIEQMGGSAFEGNLLVVGDRKINYRLLTAVLYTAGQAQLSNYRFVTISPQ